jgi:hypothetical protein
MFKPMHLLCTSLIALSIGPLQADSPDTSSDDEFFSTFPAENTPPLSLEAFAPISEASAPSASEIKSTSSPIAEQTPKKTKPKTAFKPFTGKVKGKKVRLRTQPDLESAVAKELQRGEYVAVVDEADDFWAVEPPAEMKAYVFRSFVLDNIIEGNRVNVRLHPHTDAPVIMHLNSGDQIEGSICSSNHKWIEISTPSTARFYISKSYLENVGGPELKKEHDTRLSLVKEQMELAEYFCESEMKKQYNEIDFDKMNHHFQIVIQDYSDFPEYVEKAKNALAQLQEQFIDKRISYMESKIQEDYSSSTRPSTSQEIASMTDKMKTWQPIEEALFLSWSSVNGAKDPTEYQAQQKLTAQRISGILEPYSAAVKCKPGDYIVRQNDLPVGYVYSTVVNLQNLIGKKVTLVGSPRPNNNFAFPAYFVLAIED